TGSGADPALAPPAPDRQPPAAGPAEPAQRLLVTNGAGGVTSRGDAVPPEGLSTRETFEWYLDQAGAYGVVGPLAEIRPDGDVVPLELDDLPGVDLVRDVLAMPDGRLAVLGLVDRMPGTERTDGPCVAGIETPLLVVEPDGSVSSSRDLRTRCQTLDLVAVDAETAYLARDSRLVAHDLATGDERLLLDSAEAVPVEHSGMDYAGGRLAVAISDPACSGIGGLVVRVTDVATGDSRDHPLPGERCQPAGGPVRLSPDGRYAAVAYHWFIGDDTAKLGMAVLDLAGGTVVEDRQVAAAPGPDLGGDYSQRGVGIRTAAVVGLAWRDPQTLRRAWYEVPSEGVYWLPDVVEVTEVQPPR
ncbi:MAG: hypothetical protein ACRDT2_24575, partial [Natronosporangium sp.]